MSGFWLISYGLAWIWLVALSIAVVLILRQFGVLYLSTPDAVARDGIPAGIQAPPFVAEDIYGGEHRIGGPHPSETLLVFGSPTCEPCRRLGPDLNRFNREVGEEIRVLFVSQGSYESNRRFSQSIPLEVPVLAGGEGRIASAYGVRVTPFAFLINKDGRIVRKGLANHAEHLKALAFGSAEATSV